MLKIASLGTCLSSLTAVHLVSDFGCRRLNNLNLSRSDIFRATFVDKSQTLPPIETFAEVLGLNESDPDNIRRYLVENYPDRAGVMDFPDGTKPFMHNAVETNFDLIVCDNLGDTVQRAPRYKGKAFDPFLYSFPVFEAPRGKEFWQDCEALEPLTASQSAQHWAAIVAFLSVLQPKARFVFLCAPASTCTDLPDRYARATGFFNEFAGLASSLPVDIISPIEAPIELTKLPADRDHFDMPVYRAMAGHIFLSHISKWPKAIYGQATSTAIALLTSITSSAAIPAPEVAAPAPPVLAPALTADEPPQPVKYARSGKPPEQTVTSPHALLPVLAAFLCLPPQSLSETSGVDVTERWDSLNQLHLIARVEDTFGLKFAFDDVVNAHSVRKIRAAMRHVGIIAADDPGRTVNLFSSFADRALALPNERFALFVTQQQERELSNDAILRYALGVAQRLKRLPRQSIVAIVLDHSEHLYTSFIGCVLSGLIPTILPPLTSKQDPTLFRDSMEILFDRIQPAAIITLRSLEDSIPRNSAERIFAETFMLCDAGVVDSLLAVLCPSPVQNDIAFLQHSSGTTGNKKGVMLSHDAVMAQVGQYAEAIALQPGDPIVSWLPLYHDMGLITSFIIPAVIGCPIISLDALEWVVNPLMLFNYVEQEKACFTWLPNFAFNHIARSDQGARTWDLTSIKAIVNCSEPCRKASFVEFVRKYEKMGVGAEKLTVSYAMAENVFAVTQSKPWADERRETGETPYLSSGCPLPNVEIRICNNEGDVLSEGEVGEICIRSDCLFDGYYKLPDMSLERLRGGWYFTRDQGVLVGGELTVFGRLDDLLIINGKNIVAHEVEDELNELPGIAPGRILVCAIHDELVGSDRLYVLAEAASADIDAEALVLAVRARVTSSCGITPHGVEVLPRGFLVKSTSGKLARAQTLTKWRTVTSKQYFDAPAVEP